LLAARLRTATDGEKNVGKNERQWQGMQMNELNAKKQTQREK